MGQNFILSELYTVYSAKVIFATEPSNIHPYTIINNDFYRWYELLNIFLKENFITLTSAIYEILDWTKERYLNFSLHRFKIPNHCRCVCIEIDSDLAIFDCDHASHFLSCSIVLHCASIAVGLQVNKPVRKWYYEIV